MGLNKKLQCIVINSIKLIHKSCFMCKEKNNLLPRKFSGGLTQEVTFDQMNKGKVRFWDLGQRIPQRKLYLHGRELPNWSTGLIQKSGSSTHINSNWDASVCFIELRLYFIRTLLEVCNGYNHMTKYKFQKLKLAWSLSQESGWHTKTVTVFVCPTKISKLAMIMHICFLWTW